MQEKVGRRILAVIVGGGMLGGALVQVIAMMIGLLPFDQNISMYGIVGGAGLGLMIAAKWLPGR